MISQIEMNVNSYYKKSILVLKYTYIRDLYIKIFFLVLVIKIYL